MALDRHFVDLEDQVEVVGVQVRRLKKRSGNKPATIFGKCQSFVENHRIELVSGFNLDEELSVDKSVQTVIDLEDEVISLFIN